MNGRLPEQPKDRHGFKIGVICALNLEAGMVELVYDHEWKRKKDGNSYGRSTNDPNTYRTGVIASHNVVLGYCPSMGSNSAAQVATSMMTSFTGIKIIFVVGICGAVPYYIDHDEREEILLGDCLISTGVVQFDFGRHGPGGFAKKEGMDALGRANTQVRGFMNMLQGPLGKRDLKSGLLESLEALQVVASNQAKYPGRDQDRLYKSSYIHNHQTTNETCEKCNIQLGICEKSCQDLGCSDDQLVQRQESNPDVAPNIHFGYFGSSNTVLKSGQKRDQLANSDKIIAFEMEGAGVWDVCSSTIVIKGACDYADSHKNKKWQAYAAAVAAAGLKSFLEIFEFPEEIDSKKGRKRILAELEERLFTNHETRRFAIFGLGGVGKSQLALAFCNRIKVQQPGCSIFWVSALSGARFKQDYAEIAKTCSISGGSNKDDVAKAVQEYLSSEAAGQWLLVVDNADDKHLLLEDDNSISNKLPQSEQGRILFTTRYKDLAVHLTGSGASISNLEEMEPSEAKEFLTKHLAGNTLTNNEIEVEDLITELGCLPLAIAQASSYILRSSITIGKYLALIRSTSNDFSKFLSEEFYDYTTDKDTRNAIAVTWIVSFERLQREEPAAVQLLFFLASIENKAIPLSMLPELDSTRDTSQTAGVLMSYSFLTEREDEMYEMHRLVHRAIEIWMKEQNVTDMTRKFGLLRREIKVFSGKKEKKRLKNGDLVGQWKQQTIAHLADIFPSREWQNRNTWQAYAPHAIRVLQDTGQTVTESRAKLCLKLGLCLDQDGRISEAGKWIKECVMWSDRELPNDSPDRLSASHHLAYAYLANGQAKKAVELQEKVVAIRTKVLAEDHPHRLASQQVLARAYLENGQVKDAVELLEKVVAIHAKVLAEDHPDRLASQHELAGAYLSNGQVKDAVELLEKVVAIRARVLAEDHPDRLASQHELARAYLSNGQVKDALELLEKVVAIKARVLAEDHPSRLTSQHDLAAAYNSNGQVEDAVELLEKVVAIHAKVLAEDHPDRLASQHELAGAYLSNGQVKDAFELLEKVVAIRTEVLAEDHPDRLVSQHNLALYYEDLERFDEALSLMKHVVTIQQTSLSASHPYRLKSEAELERMLAKR